MSLFKSHTLTVKRYFGSYINGRWVQSNINTFTIMTSWQSANGRDTLTLPEGKRSTQIYKCYPEIELFVADPISGQPADVITGIDGKDYEVISCAPNQNNIINHYKIMCTRLKEGI